jgi:hypothetical protein
MLSLCSVDVLMPTVQHVCCVRANKNEPAPLPTLVTRYPNMVGYIRTLGVGIRRRLSCTSNTIDDFPHSAVLS